jgi:hypothetical protein
VQRVAAQLVLVQQRGEQDGGEQEHVDAQANARVPRQLARQVLRARLRR